MEEVHKNELDMMRLRLYEVNFDLTCEVHPNYSKTYFINILRCFNDHQMWPQNFVKFFFLRTSSMVQFLTFDI